MRNLFMCSMVSRSRVCWGVLPKPGEPQADDHSFMSLRDTSPKEGLGC
jgi:hypothetical protein